MSSNIGISSITFHDNVNTPNTGLEYLVASNASIISIDFSTTGTFTAVFEGKTPQGGWKKVIGVDKETINVGVSANNKDHRYEVDVTGLSNFRVNLTSVTSNISVYGYVVG